MVYTVETPYTGEISGRGDPDRVKEQSQPKMSLGFIAGRRYLIVLLLTMVLLRMSLANVENEVLLSTNYCSSKKHILDGIQFSAAVFQQPPLFNMKKSANGSFTYNGLSSDLLDLMSDYFNSSVKYVPTDPLEIEKYGIEEALLHQMDRNEIDLAPYWFQPMTDLQNHIELDLYVWSSKIVILQRWPAEESRLKAPIRPFSPMVWVCFMGTTLCFIGFLALYEVILHRFRYGIQVTHEIEAGFNSNEEPSLTEKNKIIFSLIISYFKHVSSVLLQGSGSIPYTSRLVIRFAVTAWLLSLIVLQNGYVGVLTSLMTVPKLKPIFNTLEEVVADGRFRITDQKHSVMTTQFLKAEDGIYKVIGDSFRDDKTGQLVFTEIFQGIDNVLRNDCVYPEGDILANFIIREDTKANGKCRLTASLNNPLPLIVHVFSGIKKGNPYSKIMNQCFESRLWSSGMISYFRNKYFPSTDQCRVDAAPDSQFKPLNLVDLSPPFFVLSLGISLSIFVFLLERINHFYVLINK